MFPMLLLILTMTFRFKLYDYQEEAIMKLRSGSILCGGVGSGKSLTALAYYFRYICDDMEKPVPLYIITTARKRDTHEWEQECAKLCITDVVVDSWNNITKYVEVAKAFFIFDEQRVVGAGTWVKSFLKIAKTNMWILLSATPGDNWLDYIPVFIANGFYRNRTEFLRKHVVYKPYMKYPVVDHYVETRTLRRILDSILVKMDYVNTRTMNTQYCIASYDKDKYDMVLKQRWDVFDDRPIRTASEACYVLRRICNEDPTRIDIVYNIWSMKERIIVFYNFYYELYALKKLCAEAEIPYAEWNGQNHEPIPDEERWMYLVQYTAGAEGWNCTETDTVVFFSQNYSYKATTQAAGRIDRLNSPYQNLWYYHIRSNSSIDDAIYKALKSKKTFNEVAFATITRCIIDRRG